MIFFPSSPPWYIASEVWEYKQSLENMYNPINVPFIVSQWLFLSNNWLVDTIQRQGPVLNAVKFGICSVVAAVSLPDPK